ncbi:MAG: IS1182 family transposase [Actinomycetota bacterium]
MARHFRLEDREQSLLFPPSVEDYLPEDHPARFVWDLVNRLHDEGKLEVFYGQYNPEGRGGAAYHPRTMLAVLLHAYSRGITSSRRISRECVENLAFHYLAANQRPDHRAIAAFRKRHLVAFRALFQEVLKLCDAAGLVELGRVAIDGRRVQGNASKDKTVTGETIDEKIAALSEELLENAERVDAAEDKEFGEARGDELPAGFRSKQERLERLKQAREVLNERERKIRDEHAAKLEARKRFEDETGEKKRGPEPKAPDPSKTKKKHPPKANTTDPDSRLMKTRDGFKQGYNGQIAADEKAGVIVASDVTQDCVDTRQLAPTLDQIEANLGRLPDEALADAGYWSPENADLQEQRGIDLYIATKKDSRQRTAGKRQSAPKGRIPRSASSRDRMERKLLTKRGQNAYRMRGPTVEGPFGLMVTRGLSRFMLRGLEAVRAEWHLWCTIHNVEKLRRTGKVSFS